MWPFLDVNIDIPAPARDANAPVFRATTDCPDPYPWLLGVFVVGLVIGYLARK